MRGSLRGRLERLEAEASGLYRTLVLPEGETVRYSGEEALDAMLAAIDESDHWLLPHMRRSDTEDGLPGLIRAVEGGVEDDE